jgi:hypothetical protein
MPLTRTQALADEIVEAISEGVPLRQFCRDKDISWRQVYYWLDEDKEFATRFARAREKGFDAIAEECLDIADDARNDWMTRRVGDEDRQVLDAEHVQRSKLRIETRLKLLAKWDPKRYGEKLDMTVDATVKGSVAYKANIPTRKKE